MQLFYSLDMEVLIIFSPLVFVSAAAAITFGQKAAPITFGKGVPNFPVTAKEEREVYAYTLTKGSSMAVLNHFWSTFKKN